MAPEGKKEKLLRLLKKYNDGKATPEEVQFIEQYFAYFDQEAPVFDSYSEDERQQIEEGLLARIRQRAGEMEQAPVRPIRREYGWVAAAAAIVLLLGSAALLFVNHKKHEPALHTILAHDVKAPSVNRATVTLAGGQKVYLDSAGNGALAQQGTVQLVKLADGKIAYQEGGAGNNAAVAYNTLTNPRGSRVINMTLADGSQVWLNAGSSITYPVAFTGNERKVDITGEAYFEVASDPARPFTVVRGKAAVEVLGTHFDVNAYEDEAAIKVTLLEGRVKVRTGERQSLLKPGQQAAVKADNIQVTSDVDTEEVMAWRNGKFRFGEAADMATIMRQVSRWYDVDVVYKGEVNVQIGGSISREVNVSQVLKMLETTGLVKFEIEGRRVTVMAASP